MEYNFTLIAQLFNLLILVLLIFGVIFGGYKLIKTWISFHHNALLQREEIIKKLDKIEEKYNEILVLLKRDKG